jgi:hypothetical protein
VPEHPPPGPYAGVALGLVGGVGLAAVWAFGAADVAMALTGVFVCLVVTVTFGIDGWAPFGVGLLAAAALAASAFALLR